jgi:hypothetical protein
MTSQITVLTLMKDIAEAGLDATMDARPATARLRQMHRFCNFCRPSYLSSRAAVIRRARAP